MGRESAGKVVAEYLRTQARALLDLDRAAAADAPDAVHQMRVAGRRLRASLATFRPLLDEQRATTLRRELRWLGRALAPARDTEVLRARFAATAPMPLAETLDAFVAAEHEDAVLRVRAALDGAAYRSLRHRLEALVDDPPLRGEADQPADKVLPTRVAGACRRVERLARTADDDVLLHDVRKAAKRARYAAEVAAPELGEPYDVLAAAMARLQSVLGDHQDSVVALSLLRVHPLLQDDPQAAELALAEERKATESLRAYPAVLVTAVQAVPVRS